MRKPLLALFLALSLTLGLAACGSTSAPEANNTASDSAPLGEHTPNRSQRRASWWPISPPPATRKGWPNSWPASSLPISTPLPRRALHRGGPGLYQPQQPLPSGRERTPTPRPALAGEALDLTGYDTIFLGYPIWNGQAPQAPLHLPGNL